MSPKKNNPVNLVLLWHMHQPQYQDIVQSRFFLPWTYLHAIKDYADMAYALEQNSAAKAVVNFTPVLLDQIEEYCEQLSRCLDNLEAGSSPELGDPLLQALIRESLEDEEEKRALLVQCTRANEKNIIDRFPEYKHLVSLSKSVINKPGVPLYLNEQFYFDLLVWYHLAWMGESVRLENRTVSVLMGKGHNYSHVDRIALLKVIRDEIREVIPRYKRLQDDGRVEISFTPDGHPILPLLFDFKSADQSNPGTVVPEGNYPGGEERAKRHIKTGLKKFETHFGHKPSGCWPAEGGVCTRTLKALEDEGIQWAASGGGVLRKSLSKSHLENVRIHHGFHVDRQDITCFFRDDNLSDMIGFTYYDWNEEDAVNNLIHHALNIGDACNHAKDTIIPIILDGENCWEHYRHNGYYFLQKLYKKIAEHPMINLTTFSDYLSKYHKPTKLKHLVPGSWVYADFGTWIGSTDKNRGWELLCQAKEIYDYTLTTGTLTPEEEQRAEQQLSICESSDWFWWFGDYNAAESVSDFDRLYRLHLKNLYRLIKQPIPSVLEETISVGHGNPENDGVMRRSE